MARQSAMVIAESGWISLRVIEPWLSAGHGISAIEPSRPDQPPVAG